jgi:hypothetical protein
MPGYLALQNCILSGAKIGQIDFPFIDGLWQRLMRLPATPSGR